MSEGDKLAPGQRGFGELSPRVRQYLEAAHSPNSVRAYLSDWMQIQKWAEEGDRRVWELEPADIAEYIVVMADNDARVSTIDRRLATIAKAYRAKGLNDPTKNELVRQTLRGIRRTDERPKRQMRPLELPQLQAIVLGLKGAAIDRRDRALLLLGFAGGLRRSELAGLKFEQIEHCEMGFWLYLKHRKSDQEGKGTRIPIPFGRYSETCPVKAVADWGIGILGPLELGDRPECPYLFRPINRHGTIQSRPLAGRDISRIIKRRVAEIGLDPDLYGGHSLRAGLVTEALSRGAPEWVVQRQTGHASTAMLSTYNRRGDHFELNAARFAGL